MKQWFIINDTAENKISYYHLACFLVLLPFDFFYSQLVIISFAAHTLIHLRKERLTLLAVKETVLPVTIYLVFLISILYSSDRTEGLDISGRQSAVFFMPLLLALNPLPLHHYRLPLLKIFALTCVVVVLYLYADALYTLHYFHLSYASLFSSAFINHNFSLPINLHATYLSMYIALATAVFIFSVSRATVTAHKFFYGIALFILAAGLLQLTSRAVVIAMLFIITSGFVLFFFTGKKRFIAGILSLAVAAMALYIVSGNSAFRQRYITEFKNDVADVAVSDEMLEPRIVRWKLAADIVKQAPVFGYGNGAEKKLLKEKYFQNKLYISYLREFNAHSQYLNFLISTGIVGLAFYLVVLGFSFIIALRQKDFLFYSFLTLIAVVSISENILTVNKGIFFYSFFLSFFLISNRPQLFYKATVN
jgi:O-antigen ligase